MVIGRAESKKRFLGLCILAWSYLCWPFGDPCAWASWSLARQQTSEQASARKEAEGEYQAALDEQTVQALLTPKERADLSRQSNIGKRMKLLLNFAAQRLEQMLQSALREQYGEITRLSNDYKTLITYAFSLIETISSKPSPRKSAYRDFDIEIRKHLRTLDRIGRVIPLSQSADITDAVRTATRLRHNALNAFAGDRIFQPSAPKHR